MSWPVRDPMRATAVGRSQGERIEPDLPHWRVRSSAAASYSARTLKATAWSVSVQRVRMLRRRAIARADGRCARPPYEWSAQHSGSAFAELPPPRCRRSGGQTVGSTT